MRYPHMLPAILLGLAAVPAVSMAAQDDYSWLGNWPTHVTLDNGTDIGLSGLWHYDWNQFSNDGGRFEDANTNRRKYLGFYVKKKGVYTAKAEFDFLSKKWQDVNLQLESKAWLGTDAGVLRLGQSKTPVGFESNTSANASTFIESALPSQVVYENRRIGADWSLHRPSWLASLGYYGGDLQGDNDGRTLAAHAAWVPLHGKGDVLHLGLALSRESPESSINGLGTETPPGARLRSTPEAGFASQLVDTGKLTGVDRIDRSGLEGLWIQGPWSVQAEYLKAKVSFKGSSRSDFDADGWYAFGSWVLTGESRAYKGGQVGNITPAHPWGAVELALRYSKVNLDDAGVDGGREHDWTLGANWYVGKHLRFQANYVRAFSTRRGQEVNPHIVEMRMAVAL